MREASGEAARAAVYGVRAAYHIAEDLFVPIFAAGRVPGWTVQVLEQFENNILIRPLTLYNGPEPRAYVPIEAR